MQGNDNKGSRSSISDVSEGNRQNSGHKTTTAEHPCPCAKLRATETKMQEHLHQVHSDPRREDNLKRMEKLIKPGEVGRKSQLSQDSQKEVSSRAK